jgi:integrase
MCVPGSPIGRSRRSLRQTYVAGRPSSLAPWGPQRWRMPVVGAAHLRLRHGRGSDRHQPRPQGPPPKPRADPDQVLNDAKRRALTRGGWAATGLRFGELAGLRRRRVHLGRALPVLEVGPTRYEAGRFGSGFKPRPKSDAGIRPVPLAPLVIEAIRRQLPPGNDPVEVRWAGSTGRRRRRCSLVSPRRWTSGSAARWQLAEICRASPKDGQGLRLDKPLAPPVARCHS